MCGRALVVAAMIFAAAACGGGSSTSSSSSNVGTCVNLNGSTWAAQVTYTGTLAACSGSSSDTYTVSQTGCDASLTVYGHQLTGTLSGNTVSWSGNYPYNSGTLTVTSADITIASDLKSATGSFKWSYSGAVQCTGTATLSATITAGGGGTGGVALDVTSLGSAFDYTQGTYLVGFRFKATSALTVTDLGYWDSNLEGHAESFASTAVGLYDLTAHTLLGSVTVQASDPATGFYRYHALSNSVAVGTSDTYALVAVTGSNNYVAGEGPGGCVGGFACSGAKAASAITVLSGACLGGGDACLTQTNTLSEPTDTSTWVNLGPNFKFAQ